MRFYLACVTILALMLIGMHSCSAAKYMSVAQAGLHHGKGGEANKGKRLHRHTHYGWYGHGHVRWIALSAAVPLTHQERNLNGDAASAGPRAHSAYHQEADSPTRPLFASTDTAGTQGTRDRVSIRSGFHDDIMEPGRTPQQIIDDAFLNIGWEQ